MPQRQGQVTVRFRSGAGTVLATDTGTTDDMGRVTADGGSGAGNAVEVEVEDTYGNRVRAPLP